MSEWFSQFGFAEVAEGLLSGAYPLDSEDVGQLTAQRIEIAYNLCEDAEYDADQRQAVQKALAQVGIEERRLPMPDHGRLSATALDRAVGDVMTELAAGRRVYLHCRAGWQRSAAVAAAVIALREQIDLKHALEIVRERKPETAPLPHQLSDLVEWWLERQPEAATVEGKPHRR